MYKIENGTVVTPPENTANVSGFPRWLASLSVSARQGLGWYAQVVYADVTEPIVDAASDTITMPTPPPVECVPDAQTIKVEGLRQAYRDAMRAFCAAVGAPVVDKMEQPEFERLAMACSNPMLAITFTLKIGQALNTLRDNDGADAWDRI